MPFWSALFDGFGTVVSGLFGFYGTYRQIEDASQESQRKVNMDISELKRLLEESLIPDIKLTTEEFSELMNEFDFQTRVLSHQITTEIIHDAKDTTQVIRKTLNELTQMGQELNDNIRRNIIPDMTEKIDASNRATEEFVRTTKELSNTIQNNLIQDVKQTMKVARGVMDDFARTNKLISKDITHVLDKVKPFQEIVFIIMILIVAVILGKLANRSDRSMFNRLERFALHASRSVYFVNAVIRLIYFVILKQEEPIPSFLLWLLCLPTATVLANKMLWFRLFTCCAKFLVDSMSIWSQVSVNYKVNIS